MVRVTAPAYVRDTDTVVALPRDRPAAVRARFRRESAAGSAIAVSAISAFELWYGDVSGECPTDWRRIEAVARRWLLSRLPE